MYKVSTPMSERKKLITKFLNSEETEYDTAIGYLMAAANFEWTIRRAMFRIGKHLKLEQAVRTPKKGTQGKQKKDAWMKNGFNSYKETWKEDIEPKTQIKFTEIFTDYKGITDAMKFRNELIHGIVPARCKEHSIPLANNLLNGAQDIVNFCQKRLNMNVMDNLNKGFKTPADIAKEKEAKISKRKTSKRNQEKCIN